MRVVEGALPDVAVAVHQRPRRAGVVALVQTTAVVFDERVHAIGVRARHGNADTAIHTGRQPLGARDLRPCLPAVRALEQTAARPAAGHRVLITEGLPHRRVHDVRIGAVNGDVDGGRPVVAIQHTLPRPAGIAALIDAPLRTRRAVLAERRDEDDVGIGGMNADLRDAVRLAEPHVCPRFASVHAAVDAIARHDVPANAGFAHADEDFVGIGFRDRNGAHGRAAHLTVGDGRPVLTAIRGLPQSAADGAEVRLLGASLHAAHRNRSAAAIGADVPPAVALQQGGVEGDDRSRMGRCLHRADERDTDRANDESGERKNDNGARRAHGCVLD